MVESTLTLGEPLPGNSFTIACGSKFGRRSHIWSISGGGKDTFISLIGFSSEWHVTLHESGQWHIRTNTPQPGLPKFLQLSHRNLIPPGQCKVGLFIMIPECSMCWDGDVQAAEKLEVTQWLSNPPLEGAVEIAIVQYDWGQTGEEWPGKSHGTTPLMMYKTDEGQVVYAVARALRPEDPLSKHARDAAAGKPRGLIAGKNDTGSLLIVET